MRITETRVKLAEHRQERLLGFATVTFDDAFVVRDLKIIEGQKGPFVAMPSRKVSARCGVCGEKNHLRARFCNQCGSELKVHLPEEGEGRDKPRLYVDIAHPINKKARQMIEEAVIAAYRDELERSRQPGYVPQQLDDFDDHAAEARQRHDERGGRKPSPGAPTQQHNGHDQTPADEQEHEAG